MAVTPKIRVKVFPQSKLRIRSVPAIPGDAATVAVGTVTTLAAGASATVVNSGTSDAAVLDFGIPRGAAGIVSSVVAGSGVTVDSSDPANPVVSSSGAVSSVDGATGAVTYGAIVAAATGKTTPVDGDSIGLSDSAASNATKKLTWANLKATMYAAFGALVSAGSSKTTIADGDLFAIADSAASNATKSFSWANLKVGVLAYLNGTAKATPVVGDRVYIGDSAASNAIKYSTWTQILSSIFGTAATKNTGTSGNNVPLLDGTNTWSAQQNISVTSAGGLALTCSDPGSLGAIMDFRHSSASPAINDILGLFRFYGRDNLLNDVEYGSFYLQPTNVTDGAESGTLSINTAQAGSSVIEVQFGGGTQIGSGPAGGSKGAGTINIKTDAYIAGVLISRPGAPVTKTSNFTVADSETYLINNKSGSSCTVTLPTASSFPGRELNFKNSQAQTVVSASSNVVPRVTAAAGTAILASGNGNWCKMVSDGTNWVIMAGS